MSGFEISPEDGAWQAVHLRNCLKSILDVIKILRVLFRQRDGLNLAALIAAAVQRSWTQTAHAQLSKATQIFLNRGVELQSMVQYADIFTLSTYTNANYTSVNWLDPGWQVELGPAPGFPWGRWVAGPTDYMPPQDPFTQYPVTTTKRIT